MPHELNPALEIWQSNYSSSGPFSTPSANLWSDSTQFGLSPSSSLACICAAPWRHCNALRASILPGSEGGRIFSPQLLVDRWTPGLWWNDLDAGMLNSFLPLATCFTRSKRMPRVFVRGVLEAAGRMASEWSLFLAKLPWWILSCYKVLAQ